MKRVLLWAVPCLVILVGMGLIINKMEASHFEHHKNVLNAQRARVMLLINLQEQLIEDPVGPSMAAFFAEEKYRVLHLMWTRMAIWSQGKRDEMPELWAFIKIHNVPALARVLDDQYRVIDKDETAKRNRP